MKETERLRNFFSAIYTFINDALTEYVCRPTAIKICTYANIKARLYAYTLMFQLFVYTMCALL